MDTQKRYIKVENAPGWRRDRTNNAILNVNSVEAEKAKINTLEKICFNEGLEPVFFNLSEYMKSGAMLSCMMMHLNYVDQTKSLI